MSLSREIVDTFEEEEKTYEMIVDFFVVDNVEVGASFFIGAIPLAVICVQTFW